MLERGKVSATCFIYEVMFDEELYLAACCLENFRKFGFEFRKMEFRPLFMYTSVPFWKYISFILQNTDMPPNILFVNKRSSVNLILTHPSLLYTHTHTHTHTYIFGWTVLASHGGGSEATRGCGKVSHVWKRADRLVCL